MYRAARYGDHHFCQQHTGKTVQGGAAHVIINEKPAARVGDVLECDSGIQDHIVLGEDNVLIEGQPAARLGSPTEHGGYVDAGSPDVFIGEVQGGKRGESYAARLELIARARDKAASASGPELAALNAAADRLGRDNIAVDYARLANATYNKDSSVGPFYDYDFNKPDVWDTKWKRARDPDKSDPATNGYTPEQNARSVALPPQLQNAVFKDPDSGFYAAIYVSEVDGSVVLCFRGTDNTGGWVNNVEQGAGLPAKQYDEAVKLAQQAYAAYGSRLRIVGDSLGGGLATAGAMATGAPTVTFNASGVERNTILRLGLDPARGAGINAYHVDGEPLTTVQSVVGPALQVLLGGTVLGPLLGNVLPTAAGRGISLPWALPSASYSVRHFPDGAIAGLEQEKGVDVATLQSILDGTWTPPAPPEPPEYPPLTGA